MKRTTYYYKSTWDDIQRAVTRDGAQLEVLYNAYDMLMFVEAPGGSLMAFWSEMDPAYDDETHTRIGSHILTDTQANIVRHLLESDPQDRDNYKSLMQEVRNV